MALDRFSRRDALHVSGVALVGLAGCLTQPPGEDGRKFPSPTASEIEHSHRVDSPESTTVRNPEGEPAVRTSARSPGEDSFESWANWDYEDRIVTAPRERDGLAISDGARGVEETTAFVSNTDLSRETLLVHQYNISECETRRPTTLEWSTELTCGDVTCVGINLTYRQNTREDGCHGDATGVSDRPPYIEGSSDSEATFVRIPARIQSYGRFGYQV